VRSSTPALDRIADRYGSAAVTTADLVKADDRPEDDEEVRRALGASRLDADAANRGKKKRD